MTVNTSNQDRLYRQVASDLNRHEGYRFYAYPDPLSALYKKYPKEKWGFVSPLDILKKLGISLSSATKLGHPWTVGIGWTHGVTPESTMSVETALRKAEGEARDVDQTLGQVLTWYKGASEVTKGVLINMGYNLGVKGLLSFKNTLAFMKAGNWTPAAENMRKSLWAKQVGGRATELALRIQTQKINSAHKAPEKL